MLRKEKWLKQNYDKEIAIKNNADKAISERYTKIINKDCIQSINQLSRKYT